MKNFTRLLFLSIFLTVTTQQTAIAQNTTTLVNMVMQDTMGQPTLNFPFQAASQSAGSVYIVGNTYSTTGGSTMLVMKYDNTSNTVVWQNEYSFSDTNAAYGIDIFALGKYVYVTGAQPGPFNITGVIKFTADNVSL